MTKHFNEFAKKHPDIVLITVSADLPFAQKRFCQTENVHNVLTLSMMKDKDFGKRYGVLIVDGPLEGLLARSVLVLDEKDHVLYEELVPEVTQEPNYSQARTIHQPLENQKETTWEPSKEPSDLSMKNREKEPPKEPVNNHQKTIKESDRNQSRTNPEPLTKKEEKEEEKRAAAAYSRTVYKCLE